MTWSDFYLTCFVAGFVLSLVSFLGGSFHLPHVHHIHLTHGGKGGGAFNFGTMTAFLAWFGGVGFILTRFYSVGLIVATGAAVVAGLIGAAIVFVFLARVLGRSDQDLDPADFEMRGVLGRASSTVRENGTGEMIFTQQGARRGVPIRSEEGQAIPMGTEVLVTRYERGIAYVREFNQTPESE
jgi:membrane protein implicated in regulation of membrane protease activity